MPLLNLPQNQNSQTDQNAQADPNQMSQENKQVAEENGVKVYEPDPTVTSAPAQQSTPAPGGDSVQVNTDISDSLQNNLAKTGTPSNHPLQQTPAANVQDATQVQAQQPVQSNNVAVQNNQPIQQSAQQPQAEGAIQTNERDFTLIELLKEAIAREASDIHLSVGNRGILRIDGELIRMNTKVLTNEYLKTIVEELLQQRKGVDITKISQYDMGYDLEGNRFRVNIFKQQGNYTVVARLVPNEIKTVEELGLPPVLKELGEVSGGLVLVTGPTGSGKSTTLAAILNNINMTQSKHIMTVEDPIEFIFPKGNCLINQREFGLDFDSWPAALKSILRQDPDIVLVGEMRDLETISSAITLSETGHLVFATLHTNSASQTMDRIIDVFPEGQQAQIRAQLANVITAVIAQRLVPLTQGGRRAVMEIMLANPAVRNTIREGKTHQIDNMIQTGQDMGMVSMSRALAEMVGQGSITVETAQMFSPHPEELNSLLKTMS